MKNKGLLRQVFALAAILILLATGLPITDTMAVAGDKQEIHLPSIQEPFKGNPKLESVLNQLVNQSKQKDPPRLPLSPSREP